MEESDREIYAWIVGQEPTPAKFDTDVLTLIKTFRYEAHASRPIGDGM
ncbi:succinate dehydrogenase flavin-adding protein (antitoxin of CptAB toxin-antitoxin module) [Caulobacter sp. BE254]|nr:succinate dehydrogenase flavin-adding protein (antitoxin of CptAB toxin-antitoxin module) [Caulobacter sp. BE254]